MAGFYAGIADGYVLDETDRALQSEITALGMAVAWALIPATTMALSADGQEPAPQEPRIVRLDTLVVTGVAPVASLTWVTDPRQPRSPV